MTDQESLTILSQAKDALEAAMGEWENFEQNVVPEVKKEIERGGQVPDLQNRMANLQLGIAQGLDRIEAALEDCPGGPIVEEIANYRGYVLITYNALIVGLLFGRYRRLGVKTPHEKLLKDAYKLMQSK